MELIGRIISEKEGDRIYNILYIYIKRSGNNLWDRTPIEQKWERTL